MKSETKKPIGTKTESLELIEKKLTDTLAEVKTKFSEKKLKNRLKKAIKVLGHGLDKKKTETTTPEKKTKVKAKAKTKSVVKTEKAKISPVKTKKAPVTPKTEA